MREGHMTQPLIAEAPPGQIQKSNRGWRFWGVLLTLYGANLLIALESSITSTALPVIVAELHAGDNYVWISNGYLLTTTAVLPFYGQVADVLGRRYPTIFAVASFVFGSGICGAATSAAMLIAGRVVQGLGAAGMQSMTLTIISDLVPVRERAMHNGMLFAVFGIGAGIGPPLGGILSENGAWRWIFYMNLPIGGVTLILLFLMLQVTYTKKNTLAFIIRSIDWVGNAMLVIAMVLIMMALSWADTRYPWSDWRIILLISLGFIGLACFHVYEASGIPRTPAIPSFVFGNRTSVVGMVLSFLQFLGTYWRIFFLPVYFQAVLLATPARAGVLILPTMLFSFPFALVSGALMTKLGRYVPIHFVGFALMSISSGLYITLNRDSSMAQIVLYQMLAGFGAGCLFPTVLPAIQASHRQEDTGAVTAAWIFYRTFGSIWGVAIPAAIFNSRFSLLSAGIGDSRVRAALATGDAYAHVSSQFLSSLSDVTREEVVDAYLGTLKVIWQVCLAFNLLGLVMIFFEKEIPLQTTVESDYVIVEEAKQVDSERDAR
ncbi:MFS general substrate transporter [Thozetella sp. PMI_491]|nr:MFS general substrate transporter [Thozetella sp. PMI_491]